MRKQQTYKEMIMKFDGLQIKREDNFDRYLSKERASEYTKEKRLEMILDKMRKIEEAK